MFQSDYPNSNTASYTICNIPHFIILEEFSLNYELEVKIRIWLIDNQNYLINKCPIPNKSSLSNKILQIWFLSLKDFQLATHEKHKLHNYV